MVSTTKDRFAIETKNKKQQTTNNSMASIQVPTEVVIETPDNLPNGAYCIGGPTTGSITKMTVYIPKNTTSREFHDIILEYFMDKSKESFYTKKNGPGYATTTKQVAERKGPNTVGKCQARCIRVR